MQQGTELCTFGWRHFTEIQKMPSSLDDDRSGAGLLQWGMLDEEELAFDDVVTRDGLSSSSAGCGLLASWSYREEEVGRTGCPMPRKSHTDVRTSTVDPFAPAYGACDCPRRSIRVTPEDS
jgi:hypothetical protein